jgi:predicted dehydrogenase
MRKSNKKNKAINTAIVGCGNAAAWIDLKNLKKYRHTFSHMTHIENNPKFKLIACADNSKKNLIKFSKKYKIKKTYSSSNKMLKDNNIDFLILCVPTKFHVSEANKALNYKNIKLVLCEKPFGFNYFKAKKTIQAYKKKNKVLIINYQRRWSAFYNNIKNQIKNKKLGKLTNIIGVVDRALYQHSSHLIDLCIFLAGSVKDVYGSVDKRFHPRIVHGYKDYSANINIVHKNNTTSFIKASSETLSKRWFELDLHFTNGRIRILNDDTVCETYKYKLSKQFKNCYELFLVNRKLNKYEDRMKSLYRNIEKFFFNKKKLNKDILSNIETLKVIGKILKKK